MATRQALLITRDETLEDEVSRLAAVAGCDLHRVHEPAGAAEFWRHAPLVVLDEEASRGCAFRDLPPRSGIVLIGTKPPPEFWRVAFEQGADHALELPDDETRLVALLAEAVEESAGRSGRVVALLGGRGGAGASTLATVTALTAAEQGQHCMLLDCDPLGGGLDLALGAESDAGLRWSGLSVSGGRVAGAALREALPGRRRGPGSLTLLSCDRDDAPSGMTPEAVRAVVAAGRRGGDTVVCDLPRSPDEAGSTAARQADLVVIVVPAEVRACAAAARTVSALGDAVAPVRAVVRGPAPGGLTVADVARAVGVEVLTAMRPQPGLSAAMDKAGLCSAGLVSRGPLARVAREVLAALDDDGADVRTGMPAGAR